MEHSFYIDGRKIGPDQPPYIVAEISGNHAGELTTAIKLISEAKSAGADAVKIQSYTPDSITIDHDGPEFILEDGLWKGQKLYELYKTAHTPIEWHKPLFEHANKIGITIFSSPFDNEAVKLLEKLGAPAYKIASFEMNDYNLVKVAAKTKKPIILSTGMSNIDEIEKAVLVAKRNGCKDLTLLYCVSNYPSKSSDFNLNYIHEFKKRFKCRVGLSDHSLGSDVAKYSLIAGATVFEKHIALQNQKKGLDIDFSLKGKEMKNYNDALHGAFQLINNKKLNRSKIELENKIFRKSVYAIKDIKKGDFFSKKNIKTFRPYKGISASFYLDILKKKSPINIKKNYPLPKYILNKLL